MKISDLNSNQVISKGILTTLMKCSLLLILLSGCVGTDYLDDPIVGSKIIVSSSSLALKVNESKVVSAEYFNQYGIKEITTIAWVSADESIVGIGTGGVITAKKAGQTLLIANAASISDTIQVVVVADENAVASVKISSSTTTLLQGATGDLVLEVYNINNQLITNKQATYTSSNEAVVTVNIDGKITAVANGIATISARVDGVKSNDLQLTVGSSSRTGQFVKVGGYQAEGTAILKNQNSKLILELQNNFKTSFALGTVIYLSNNNTSGSTVRSSGLEIQTITNGGFHSFDISAKYPNAKLEDYKYVIILCKPASLIFGFAELK